MRIYNFNLGQTVGICRFFVIVEKIIDAGASGCKRLE